MKISELFEKKEPTLSFEVFPPKTSEVYENVKKTSEKIAMLKPDFMSVTYGAGGGTSRYTIDIAKDIEDKFNVPVIAHLTCVSSTKEMVMERIAEMKEAGIHNIMALRGDIPKDMMDDDRSKWYYHNAVDLIREIKEFDNDFCIGGACYPEVHPESENQKEDIKYLKEKADAGCSFLTTQMFFDNNLLYNFLYKIREAGITIPIVAGIMPITNGKQVKRAINLSGSHMPRKFISIVDKFGENPDAMKQAGIAYATEQIIDLLANGVNAIHVYSMNNPDVAKKIQENLSDVIPSIKLK